MKIKTALGSIQDELEGTLDHAIEFLQKLKNDGKEYKLEITYDYDGPRLELVYFREEAQIEKERREEREEQLRRAQEKADRLKYEELKKKFEGT